MHRAYDAWHFSPIRRSAFSCNASPKSIIPTGAAATMMSSSSEQSLRWPLPRSCTTCPGRDTNQGTSKWRNIRLLRKESNRRQIQYVKRGMSNLVLKQLILQFGCRVLIDNIALPTSRYGNNDVCPRQSMHNTTLSGSIHTTTIGSQFGSSFILK